MSGNDKKEKRPPIDPEIKRAIRKEAFYGCAFCGNPIIEYHHIIPYHVVLCHEEHNLIALCPNHHNKADRSMIPKDRLIQLKENPYNKDKENIKDDFFIGSYNNLQLRLGHSTFIRTPNILVVDGMPLISIRSDDDNNVIMNAKFYDKTNNLIAEIVENEWIAHLKKHKLWDIQYAGGILKINSSKKRISLQFQVQPEEGLVNIKGNIFYKKCFFNITPTKVEFGFDYDNPKNKYILKGFTAVDGLIGLNLETGR